MQSTTDYNRSETVKLFSKRYSPPEVSDSSPIIFIHGWFATNRTWNVVKNGISDKTKRKIYVIDMRNHGDSEWTDEFSMKIFADDVENFMVTEKITKAVLVGHSIGGRVAITLAFKRPEMVEKLVVEDICLVDTERYLQASGKFLKLLISAQKIVRFFPTTLTELEAHNKVNGHLADLFPEMAGNASSSKISLTLPFYKTKSGRFAWEMNVEAATRLEKSPNLVALDLSDDPVYHEEMLLLGGEKSELLTKNDVDAFYRHFPKCKVFFFKGGFHNLHMEFPKEYIERVSNFIGE